MVSEGLSDKLVIVWSSADPAVARSMVFMYARNSRLKGWWHKVRLVVWGPSSRLLAENEDLQEELELLKEAGVELLACKACADMHGVSEMLSDLGIEVKYMGQVLTDMLKSDWTCLTF
jgi:hypothetical protein